MMNPHESDDHRIIHVISSVYDLWTSIRIVLMQTLLLQSLV